LRADGDDAERMLKTRLHTASGTSYRSIPVPGQVA